MSDLRTLGFGRFSLALSPRSYYDWAPGRLVKDLVARRNGERGQRLGGRVAGGST